MSLRAYALVEAVLGLLVHGGICII